VSRSPAFTERHARRAARDAGLIAQKLRSWSGFILIQPENNVVVARELTAEEVVTYCGILSATDSWEARPPRPHRQPPVGKGVRAPGGERGTSNVHVLGGRDRAAGRSIAPFSQVNQVNILRETAVSSASNLICPNPIRPHASPPRRPGSSSLLSEWSERPDLNG
jgi:hypothetical protein